jgi:hypothetical protein
VADLRRSPRVIREETFRIIPVYAGRSKKNPVIDHRDRPLSREIKPPAHIDTNFHGQKHHNEP